MKRKIRSVKGFSLAETFLAILILLLVSSIVVAGIPTAANAYYKVVEAANAQVLLSTTMTVLRDELGTAKNVTIDGTAISYTTSGGGRVQMVNGEDAAASAGDGGGAVPAGTTGGTSKDGILKRAGDASVPLVSKAAANKSLHTKYDSVSYADGVVTFTNLSVVKDSNEGSVLAAIDSFQIRVLVDTQ